MKIVTLRELSAKEIEQISGGTNVINAPTVVPPALPKYKPLLP